jgi:parallel beta-helix repeat protein
MKNVRDYGATGNGRDDDTDAIRAALADCAAGETCFVPLGTYMVRPGGVSGHTPAVTSGVKLVGESRYGSILKIAGMPTDSFLLCDGEDWLLTDLTFDMADYTPPSGQTGQVAIACRGDNWQVKNCSVINIGRTGIAAFGGNNWMIEGNFIARTVPTAQPPTTAILATARQGALPTNGNVVGNRCESVGILLSGNECVISRNRINNCGSGTGIFVAAPPNAKGALITENICTNGLSGYDDAQGGRWWSVSGFEVWAPDSIISNNIAHDNDGGGIAVGGMRTLVIGNIAYDNGRGRGERGGIAARSIDADRNASYSTFIGNKCYDTRYPDTTRMTQEWGYMQQPGITHVQQEANDYTRNKLGAHKP